MKALKEFASQAFQKELDGWHYFWSGLALMAVKINLDRAIAWVGFHKNWAFWNYFKPSEYGSIKALTGLDQNFYLILLLTALPFLVVGIALTVWRLKSAKLPLALCALFFVPAINLIFFLVLAVVPSKSLDTKETTSKKSEWIKWLPGDEIGSASLSVLTMTILGAAAASFGTNILQNYGWGLFIGLPFVMGLLSVLIYNAKSKRDFNTSMAVAVLPVFLCGAILMALAVEGLVCLLMASPLALAVAFFGGALGYSISQNCGSNIQPMALFLLFIAAPLSMGMEREAYPAVHVVAITSVVEIKAPIEKVWRNVITFPPIKERPDWLLSTGIAYPERAKIDGYGQGAVRHCIFNTGEFIEPIEIWQAPHLLKFSVAKQPKPLEELSPYKNIKAPHLNNYLQSKEGQFKLTELADGKTMLQGTTWYSNKMWPEFYWQMWSDLIIHHIHMRVLSHIKTICEQN